MLDIKFVDMPVLLLGKRLAFVANASVSNVNVSYSCVAVPVPVPTPVAVNIVSGLLSAAPINVKSVLPVDTILYVAPTRKLPATIAATAYNLNFQLSSCAFDIISNRCLFVK